MRAACKIIINNGRNALSEGLERVLTSPLVRDEMLAAKECDELLEHLAEIDIAAYSGGVVPHGGLAGVMSHLEKAGVLTADVWQIYRRPS